jgi:hypothetical protein
MKEAKPEDAQFPDYREITRSCIEPSLQKSIWFKVTNGGTTPVADAPGDAVSAGWVDYILTTANSWKTPIKSFELIVEKDAPKWMAPPTIVSFCWDGPVKKLDETHFQATTTDFVPKHELHILFMSVAK